MKYVEFHKQPTFRLIWTLTLALTALSFSIIYYKLGLELSLSDMSSYDNIEKIIYVPKLVASSGFALLAFYALWFRINQTALQIQVQEAQIKELKTQKKSDQLIGEMNNISDRVFDMIFKVEKPTKFVVRHYLHLGNEKQKADSAKYVHNHATQLTEISYSNGHTDNLEWEGTIKNLKVYLLIYKNLNPNENNIEAYKQYEDSVKPEHHTIASQLNMLVVVAIKLAEMDSSNFSYIRNILSLYREVTQILDKVGLMQPTSLSMMGMLQDLERPRSAFDINLSSIFSQEMLEDNLIDQQEADTIRVNIKQSNVDNNMVTSYEIKIQHKTFHRINGIYTEIPKSLEK